MTKLNSKRKIIIKASKEMSINTLANYVVSGEQIAQQNKKQGTKVHPDLERELYRFLDTKVTEEQKKAIDNGANVPAARDLVSELENAIEDSTASENILLSRRAIVQRYLDQLEILKTITKEVKTKNTREDIGATPPQDATYIVTAEDMDSVVYEDIDKELKAKIGEGALQAFAHRPGISPPGSPTLNDLFNDDKLKAFEPRYASLMVLKPQRFSGAIESLPDDFIGPPANLPGFEVLFETNEFLLQATSEQSQEKFQVVETFGDPFLFTFGARHEIFTYAGVLMNTNTFNWKNKFNSAYTNDLRASQAIKKGAKVYLTYDDVIREGHILSYSYQHSEQHLNHVMFTFSMYITKKIYMGGQEELVTETNSLVQSLELARRLAESQNVEVLFIGNPFHIAPPEGAPPAYFLVDNAQRSSVQLAFETYVKSHMLDLAGRVIRPFLRFTTQNVLRRSDNGILFDLFRNMRSITGIIS